MRAFSCSETLSALPAGDSGFTIAHQMPRKKKEDASCGLTQVQLAEATKTTKRSISCYQKDDGVPPSSIVMFLARALQVSADERLGLKPPKTAASSGDGDEETRRLWKRLQAVTQSPEKDQRAVIRLVNSLAAIAAPRQGERHGR